MHLFLPALTIALAFSTILVRTLRASMLAVLASDFVDTARIKGISRARRAAPRHVVRNAIISLVVVFGINLAFLISGTVSRSRTCSRIPGLGQPARRLRLDARLPGRAGDDAVFAFLVVVVNLLTDVVHAALDPRVSADERDFEPVGRRCSICSSAASAAEQRLPPAAALLVGGGLVSWAR